MITSHDLGSIDATGNDDPRRAQLITESAEAFRRDGCVLLEHVIDAALVEDLQDAFTHRHGSSGRPRGALRVGHQRYMITVRLTAPFTDSRLYASPALSAIVDALLGADWILFGFGAVVSHPGAEDQHVHSDGASLFGDPDLEAELPPYAITTIVPLVDMNDETGTTRVWPGSHRMSKSELENVEHEDPVVSRGGALLMDYRLHHGGRANRSSAQRPILSLVVARPWFRDAVNFTEQMPLSYRAVDRRRMPPELVSRLPVDPVPSTGRRASAIGRELGARARAKFSRS